MVTSYGGSGLWLKLVEQLGCPLKGLLPSVTDAPKFLGIIGLLTLPLTVEASTSTVDYLAHLRKWEGYSLTPYPDGPRGSISVGIGHSLTAHGETPKSRYTDQEVMILFYRDLDFALETCRKGIPRFDTLPLDVRQMCVGVAFGVGRTGFERFVGFRLAISYRAWNGARHELGLSRWARQVAPSRRDAYLAILRSQP